MVAEPEGKIIVDKTNQQSKGIEGEIESFEPLESSRVIPQDFKQALFKVLLTINACRAESLVGGNIRA